MADWTLEIIFMLIVLSFISVLPNFFILRKFEDLDDKRKSLIKILAVFSGVIIVAQGLVSKGFQHFEPNHMLFFFLMTLNTWIGLIAYFVFSLKTATVNKKQ